MSQTLIEKLKQAKKKARHTEDFAGLVEAVTIAEEHESSEMRVITDEDLLRVIRGAQISDAMRKPWLVTRSTEEGDRLAPTNELRKLANRILELSTKREIGYLCEKHQRGSKVEGAECSECYRDEVQNSSKTKRKCMICGYGRYCNNCQAHGDNHAAMFPESRAE